MKPRRVAIGFALLMALDCATFAGEMRWRFLERLAAFNATQASEAAAVWAHDANTYSSLLDALKGAN